MWNWIVKNAKKSIFTILWALNFEFLWIGTNFWYEFFPKPKLKASKLSHQQFLRHDWFHIKSEQKKKKNEFPHWLKMRNSHQAKKFQFQLNIASLKNILESKFLKYLLCICLTHSHCRKWEIFFHQKYISWKQLFFTNFFSIKTFSRIYLQKMSKRKFVSLSTLWKLGNFPAILILREINFGWFQKVKISHFNNFGGLESRF